MSTKKGFRTLCLNLHVLVEEDLSRKLFPEWDFQEDISRKRCPGVHVEENMFWKNYPDNSRNWVHRWDFQDDMSNEQEDMSWYKCPGRHVHNANLTVATPLFIIYCTHILKSGINWLFCTLLKNLLVFGWFQNSKFRSVLRPCSFPSLPKFFCKFVFAGCFKL